MFSSAASESPPGTSSRRRWGSPQPERRTERGRGSHGPPRVGMWGQVAGRSLVCPSLCGHRNLSCLGSAGIPVGLCHRMNSVPQIHIHLGVWKRGLCRADRARGLRGGRPGSGGPRAQGQRGRGPDTEETPPGDRGRGGRAAAPSPGKPGAPRSWTGREGPSPGACGRSVALGHPDVTLLASRTRADEVHGGEPSLWSLSRPPRPRMASVSCSF